MSILDSKLIWTLWFLAGRCWKDRSSPCNQRALARECSVQCGASGLIKTYPCQHHINTCIILLYSNSLIQNPFARFRQVLQGVAHCHRTLAAIALDQGVVAVTGQIISPRMGITSLSSQVEFRISRSRIYAPRPQASEYPRGWRTVQDHRLRIGPTFSALAHWILSSKTTVVQYSTSHSRQTLMSHFHLICTSHCLTCLQGVDQSPSLWWLYGIVRQSWSWWTDDNACPPPQFFVVVFSFRSALLFYLRLYWYCLFCNDVPWCSMTILLQGMDKVLTFGPWAASLQRWPQIVLFFQATLKSTRRLDSQTWSQGSWKCPCNLCWCIPKSSKIPFLCKLWFALHKLLHFPIIHELHCDINFSNVRFTLIQHWSTFHSIH